MSTRSILALQKGNHVRYLFVHWDGDNHGQTLKTMTDAEIEDLYGMLEPLDTAEKTGKGLQLEHLYSNSYWDGYLAKQRENWEKEGRDPAQFADYYLKPQPTAHTPLPDNYEREFCGAIDTSKPSPETVYGAIGTVPHWCCEYVWHYNLDTRTITCFHGNDRTQSSRRKRLTPKKFSFDWL